MRAVDYSRVSTEEQSEHGHSIDEQRDRNLEHINKQKWTLVDRFVDPGCSGKNLRRKDIQRLLQAVDDGLIDVIVVHKLDRLTRNIGDLHDLLKLFDKKNVKFVSVTENIDTSTAMGRMVVFLLGILAQWYRENLGEEVRKGMTGRAKKGLHNITVPLFGYDRGEDGELLVIPNQAETVRWIFNQYIRGLGSSSIAKKLNERGIRRNRGAQWDQHKVMMTLTNYHYIGKIHWKAENLPESERIIRDGKHESIVPLETFEEAQRILQRRREGTISQNSYEYIFGGIVRCGACGGGYKGKYNLRPKGLYRGYVCSNNERYGSCSQSGISERRLAKLLFDTLSLKGRDAIGTVKKVDNGRDEIVQKLAESEARRGRWQLAYGDGLMPYQDFAKRMKEEMEHVVEWEEQLSEMPDIEESQMTPEEALSSFHQIIDNWEFIDSPLRKEFIQKLLRKIVIKKTGKEWEIEDIITT